MEGLFLLASLRFPRFPPIFTFFVLWDKCSSVFFVAQAKKDVSQLLGRNKKKKGRPAGKRAAHQPSPERAQAMPSPSSIFDRKPLPGIGRQPLQGGGAGDRQISATASTKADNAVVLTERSPSRTQPSSLVGHRLSQHLSVSVGSEEGDEKSAQEQKSGGDSMKPSPGKASLRTRQDGSPSHGSAAAIAGLHSEHEAMLTVSAASTSSLCSGFLLDGESRPPLRLVSHRDRLCDLRSDATCRLSMCRPTLMASKHLCF